ncbi:MAG TPA: sugar transferase [Terracidiphilus sp.]|nr:sugar transferase [Terracidiphilus sp.]
MSLASQVCESGTVAIGHSSIPPRTHRGIASYSAEAVVSRCEGSPWSLSASKRAFDILVALLVLAIFAIPMLAMVVAVRLTSSGPALFVQKRVGRRGRRFSIYKIRSMAVPQPTSVGPGLTMDGDLRITKVGRWLRKLKLDELPQFFNILRGDMSLVGPRPKLPRYAALMNMPYRPGITGAATLAFRGEEEILSCVHPSQLETFYTQHIRPLKARMDVRYMSRATFWSDMRLIAATILSCAKSARVPRSFVNLRRPATAMQLQAEPAVNGD